jgi:putative FmdB family regulatory protein
MPTYDYRCTACGHEFEKFQQITNAAIRVCPKCGKRKVRRLIGIGAGIIFKGSGFHQTDYRSESYKKAAEKDKAGGDGSSKAPAAEAAGKASSGAGEASSVGGKASSSAGEASSVAGEAGAGAKGKVKKAV